MSSSTVDDSLEHLEDWYNIANMREKKNLAFEGALFKKRARMQSCVFPRMPLSPILKSVGGPDEVFNIRPTFENSPQSRQFSPTNVLNVPRPRTASSSEPCQREPAEVSMEYLAELIKERKQLEMFPTIFPNVDRLVDDEITRVRVALFQCEFMTDEIKLPEPMGEIVTITEKLYVPKKEHPDVIEETRTHPDGTVTVSHRYSPDYNFVGRILGPRGMTAKQLEQETGCKIMVRGRGSMRDRRKEELNRGKPNWEHLDDDLHVLVQCEDAENRSRVKLRAAVEQVKKLLTPAPEGTDELKRKQLMELAIINGTYRPHNKPNNIHTPRLVTPLYPVSPMRQLIVSPQHSPTGHAPMMPGSPSFQAPTLDYSKLVSPSSFMDVLSSFSISGHEMGPPLTPMGFPNGSVLGGHFFHDTHHLHSNPASPAPTTVAN